MGTDRITGRRKTVRAAAAPSKLAPSPKTTRPDSPSRREAATDPGEGADSAARMGRTLDAFPDRIDLRDWPYQPTLAALPDEIVNCAHVPEVLNQGQEGACTGFALAAVVNYLLAQRGIPRGGTVKPRKDGARVSPRMLYELARRYDEWPGDDYVGSSARGAMKAWERHGVCSRDKWTDEQHGAGHFDERCAEEARRIPGGAYYRVDFRQVRDLHAALHEVGIVYATLMVHEGWSEPGPATVSCGTGKAKRELPVIERKGRADSGHAVALVGYTAQGFIVQNSWGEGWGSGGFALLPYEDFMLHTTDVWVAQLGVPVTADLWAGGAADTLSGTFRAGEAIPLADIRPYVIDVGNNGALSDRGNYWTTERDLERLFLSTIPERTAGWKKRRVMLYLHGGLNSEKDVAKRIVAFRDVCLANEIYPLHIMWETDWFAAAKNILEDQFTAADERAGGSFLDHLRDARDRVLELTLALPGGALWGEMKENAQLASEGNSGAMNLVVKYAKQAKASIAKQAKKGEWELHVVAHSAGSILAAHAIPSLASLGLAWKTLQFLAPAMRMELFKKNVMPHIAAGKCPRPSLYILSDTGERDDDVGPYGKSLLYLVSNAFEGERGVALLGMQKFLEADARVRKLLEAPVDGRQGIVVAGATPSGADGQPEPDPRKWVGSHSRSDTHGGFDNDAATMNSVLTRILGEVPGRMFVERDLQF